MRTTLRRALAAVLITAAAGAAAHETLYPEDGAVYAGDVTDGRPNGRGRMTWPDGERHGEGIERFGRDARYEGAYRDGHRGPGSSLPLRGAAGGHSGAAFRWLLASVNIRPSTNLAMTHAHRPGWPPGHTLWRLSRMSS